MEQNNQNPAYEQDTEVQQPDVQNVANVVTLPGGRSEANESGRTAPAKVVESPTLRLTADELKIRAVFQAAAQAEHTSDSKAAICVDLFLPLTTPEQVRSVTRHAIYGYIWGRAGRAEAEKFYALRNGSEHDCYKVAVNAVARAKKRAEKAGWVQPRAKDTGRGSAAGCSTRTGRGE